MRTHERPFLVHTPKEIFGKYPLHPSILQRVELSCGVRPDGEEKSKVKNQVDVRAWCPRLHFGLANEPFNFADWTCGLMNNSLSAMEAEVRETGASIPIRE
jgi:hypothetical protein